MQSKIDLYQNPFSRPVMKNHIFTLVGGDRKVEHSSLGYTARVSQNNRQTKPAPWNSYHLGWWQLHLSVFTMWPSVCQKQFKWVMLAPSWWGSEGICMFSVGQGSWQHCWLICESALSKRGLEAGLNCNPQNIICLPMTHLYQPCPQR